MKDILKEKEFMNMKLYQDQATQDEREIVKDYKRRRGILRKEQLEIMNQFVETEITNINSVT